MYFTLISRGVLRAGCELVGVAWIDGEHGYEIAEAAETSIRATCEGHGGDRVANLPA